ncbi:2-succinyl-5-enolpyruvyl-6-hydroxy-3-cyclohexene-1-carboxylic-acid synthase [soil metagenome]
MATVIVDELVRNGIDRLVLSPGSRSGALAMVAASEGRLQTTVAIDERSAGFWAVGYAKAAGKPAAVVTTSGTAVANLYPAVVEASESLTPLVIVTADRPSDLRYTGANQTIDQVEIFGRYPRFFADVPEAVDVPGEAAEWRSLVSRAVAATNNGPVHLNVSFREPLVPVADDGRDVSRPYLGDTTGRSHGGPWHPPPRSSPLSAVFQLEPRDLVVAGTGADRELVEQALVAGAPVIAEGHSNCRIPGTISTAHHLLSGGFEALLPSRMIVLGRAGLSRPLNLLAREIDTLAVEPKGGDPSRRNLAMVPVNEFQRGKGNGSFHELWMSAEQTARSIIDRDLDSQANLTEPRTARDLWLAIPEGSVLSIGSSMPVRDLDWFAPPRDGVHVIANRGASGIDGFLSLALGAASIRQPAYGLVGDLSFLHDSNGFLTTPRSDLTLVVVNNQGGGVFSFLPAANFSDHFERVFATPAPVDIERLVGAYGACYQRVESAEALSAAVATQPTGIGIIEIRTDRTENVAVHRRLTEAVVLGVGALLEG